MGQHRQVAEEELVRHVARVGRGVGLAVRAIEAVRALPIDRERRRDPVLVEEELGAFLGVAESPGGLVDRGVEAGALREQVQRPGRKEQRGGQRHGRRGRADPAEPR